VLDGHLLVVLAVEGVLDAREELAADVDEAKLAVACHGGRAASGDGRRGRLVCDIAVHVNAGEQLEANALRGGGGGGGGLWGLRLSMHERARTRSHHASHTHLKEVLLVPPPKGTAASMALRTSAWQKCTGLKVVMAAQGVVGGG
jgi:hypothetical protein